MTIIVAAVAGAALALSACSSSGGGDSTGASGNKTIRIVTSVDQSIVSVAIQAAQALGTWKGTGLDVQVINGTTPTTGPILASGKADIIFDSGVSIATNMASGLKVTLVAGNDLPWDTRMIVPMDSKAKSIDDLKGANFGITGKGGPGDYTLGMVAKALGWGDDYKETTLKDLSALTAALASGSIDAFPWGSEAGYQMEAEGTGKILGATADYVGPSLFHGFAVSDTFLKEHPAELKTFFDAYFKKVNELMDQPDTLVKILENDWHEKPAAAENIVKNDFPLLSKDGEIPQANLDGLLKAAEFSAGKTLPGDTIHYKYWKDLG